ncbi:MAG: efflux RND transporter permease subunit [Aestuariivita sp.]|nr:efflux RND transporter permease subunit [Aestuariivita sp.]MCY4347834.1 efflux RND transporter permease subunit [Aestuariivita sp.]
MVRSVPLAPGGLFSYFTRHPTAANLLLVVMLVLGLAAAPNMRAQFFPDVIVDNVTVDVTWDGAGPEDVDNAIIQALEPALLAVDGVEQSNSFSRDGRASITLDFKPGWDLARAADDVQSAVDAVTSLPEEADEPKVRRGVWRDRVTDLVITGPIDVKQLALLADELVAQLFVAGVTRTTIRGVAAPETIVAVSSARLVEHDISMTEIARAIAAEVDADPAGDIDGANARVRTGTEKRSPEDIAGIVLRSNPDGSKLTIGAVASVQQGGPDRERAYFVHEHPAISIRVDRSDKGDAIGIQRIVETVAENMQPSLPQGVTIDLIRTRAEAITGRLDILLDNGLTGFALVLCLLFLFLNARTAFWVAAGVPAAMMAAIALMYAVGLTINMVSLFGLIITLGIVVDDAIVVGEHADYRYRNGEHPFQAAERAAQRMAKPVFAATLTTIIAFYGLVIIGGRFGDLIRDIPFTVIVVLAASLLECFLILPHHMAKSLLRSEKQAWYDAPSRAVNRGFQWIRDHVFRGFLRWLIRGRYAVIAGLILLLATQLAVFLRGDIQWRFFNAPERGSVTGNFAMTEGASREDSLEMMRELQRATEMLGREYEARHGTNPLLYVMAEVGGNAGRRLSGVEAKDPDLLGGISIELIDADSRPYSSFAFVGELQDSVRRHPLVETISFRGWRSGPSADALDVQFYGAEVAVLKAASLDLQEALLAFPEVSAVQDNLAYDKEEIILDLTPQGQALGFTIDTLGRAVRSRLNGIEAATYPDGMRSAAIRVELSAGELTADFLERTQMRTPSGHYVPLADLVRVESRTGFTTVRRENGVRLISVTGDISEDDPARAEEIIQRLEQDILPGIASERQVEWRLAGLSEQENNFLSDALTGLILCLTGIYLVLAWIFSSWSRPLIIMAIIPFGLVGTIYGHGQWEVPLSMFTVVGLLGLVGIIINDSIVLVNTIDDYAQSRGLIPSIIDATADRLRPVLLTTLTTVLGLTPLLFETSQQALFLKPTVITLVYGLGFGMFLVLLIVPALVAIQADVRMQMTAMTRAMRSPNGFVRSIVGSTLVFVLVWFALTMGATILFGSMPLGISDYLPLAAFISEVQHAFLAFIIGSLTFCVLVLMLASLAALRLPSYAGRNWR